MTRRLNYNIFGFEQNWSNFLKNLTTWVQLVFEVGHVYLEASPRGWVWNYIGDFTTWPNLKQLFEKSDYLGVTRFWSWACFFWRPLLEGDFEIFSANSQLCQILSNFLKNLNTWVQLVFEVEHDFSEGLSSRVILKLSWRFSNLAKFEATFWKIWLPGCDSFLKLSMIFLEASPRGWFWNLLGDSPTWPNF